MRKVKHDGTISIQNKLFEVPQKYIGRRIEVRFNKDKVYIYENGLPIDEAKPVNFADNAHVKRERTLSFKSMLREG